MTIAIPETVDGLPNIAGHEADIDKALKAAAGRKVFRPENNIDFGRIKSAFAIALHMHQPLIPAGGDDLRTAEIISNLQYMMDHQEIGDNHNAAVFLWCYQRMGEFIPQLVDEGKEPRVMLDYSGTLLHGLRQMGLNDVFDALQRITCDPAYRRGVEWLGCPWGHAVAPSTPVQDYRLHVRAWQHHFAGIFGLEALRRVRGFSPPEMALPNHPDVAYEFVRTLRDCGYNWVLVQEHTVEQPANGHGPERTHLPHRLVAPTRTARPPRSSRSSRPRAATPSWSARCSRTTRRRACRAGSWPAERAAAGHPDRRRRERRRDDERVPAQVHRGVREASGSETPPMNVTEYLEYLRLGHQASDLPPIQPIHQKKIWDRSSRARPGGWQGHRGLQEGRPPLPHGGRELDQQHLLGRGYDNLLGPMEKLSSHFYEMSRAEEARDRRAALPQRPVPPAVGGDQLLPLLGPGCLDRLRPGDLPPRRRDPQSRLRGG